MFQTCTRKAPPKSAFEELTFLNTERNLRPYYYLQTKQKQQTHTHHDHQTRASIAPFCSSTVRHDDAGGGGGTMAAVVVAVVVGVVVSLALGNCSRSCSGTIRPETYAAPFEILTIFPLFVLFLRQWRISLRIDWPFLWVAARLGGDQTVLQDGLVSSRAVLQVSRGMFVRPRSALVHSSRHDHKPDPRHRDLTLPAVADAGSVLGSTLPGAVVLVLHRVYRDCGCHRSRGCLCGLLLAELQCC